MKTKELVYLNTVGTAITTTLILAEVLGINHADVFNEVTRELEEEKNEYEADGGTAEDGELWMYYWKSTFTDSQGKTHNIYEITQDGLEVLTWSYKDKEALIKEVLLEEFNKLDPPIFRIIQEITEEKQIEAILQVFDSNHEVDRLFKKAALKALNRRAMMINQMSRQIREMSEKLHNHGLS